MQQGHSDYAGSRPDRVILYGPETDRWRDAMALESGIWDGMPGVRDVLVVNRLNEVLRAGWSGWRQSIVIPLRRRALRHFPRLWWNLAPSRFAHETCVDKIRFDGFMRQAGLAEIVPRSWRLASECRFPCVIKRDIKEGGTGVRVVASAEEVATAMQERPFLRRPVMFQEYIEGLVDHATHCVAVDGRIVWHTSYAYDLDPVSRVQTQHVHGGRKRIEAPPDVVVAFERVLSALRYSGPASVDWRPTDRGPVLFEINPRFGGSMMLDINRDDLRAGLAAVVAHARPPEWLPRPE